MSLLASLLKAIVSVDGDALVIHAEETPYVIGPSGQVPVSSRTLGYEAVNGVLGELLAPESMEALDAFGAIQYELPPDAAHPDEHFTVVAARGSEDVWMEIRRRKVPDDEVPDELFADRRPSLSEGSTSVEGDSVGGEAAATESLSVVPQPLPASAGGDAGRDARGESGTAVVVPLTRTPARPSPPAAPANPNELARLLRTASARGASTLYLVPNLPPALRVDGEVKTLDGEPPIAPGDVETLLFPVMPERNREELRQGADSEWVCDLPEVGRVRCVSFRDQRGAGAVFRLMALKPASADQLGVSREIQALTAEPDGLVIIAGPRSSGKRTLVAALVDLVNRTRRDHVITIEREIRIVHERKQALVSQREVRGDAEQMLATARAALRENPDVLVLGEVRTADLTCLALDAAASGHLVIAVLPARSATEAVDRVIDAYPPERRHQVQLALADCLRGVVMQVLVPRTAGGLSAAREVLLNTPAVASAIADGRTSQLIAALESGRRHGMVPLNDALAGLVEAGGVDAREAYRRSADRPGLLAALGRHGLDTSFAEKPA